MAIILQDIILFLREHGKIDLFLTLHDQDIT